MLYENQKVTVHRLSQKYIALIRHVANKTAIIFINQKTDLYPGDEVILEITGHDALYIGAATVIKVFEETSVYVIKLTLKFQRIQRREFNRVTTCIQAVCAFSPDLNMKYPAIILDLSGNGARMQTITELELCQPVQLMFTLNNNEEQWNFQLKAYPKRCISRQPYYQYGVCFDNINELEQNKIIKYVQQRSLKLFQLEPGLKQQIQRDCVYA